MGGGHCAQRWHLLISRALNEALVQRRWQCVAGAEHQPLGTLEPRVIEH